MPAPRLTDEIDEETKALADAIQTSMGKDEPWVRTVGPVTEYHNEFAHSNQKLPQYFPSRHAGIKIAPVSIEAYRYDSVRGGMPVRRMRIASRFESSGTTSDQRGVKELSRYSAQLYWEGAYHQLHLAHLMNGLSNQYDLVVRLPARPESSLEWLFRLYPILLNTNERSMNLANAAQELQALEGKRLLVCGDTMSVYKLALQLLKSHHRIDAHDWTLIHAGGFKSRERVVAPDDFLIDVCRTLEGVYVLEEFGMSELFLHFYRHRDRGFICPRWAHVYAETEAGEVARHGEHGRLVVYDPLSFETTPHLVTNDMVFTYLERIDGHEYVAFYHEGRAPESVARGCSL